MYLISYLSHNFLDLHFLQLNLQHLQSSDSVNDMSVEILYAREFGCSINAGGL